MRKRDLLLVLFVAAVPPWLLAALVALAWLRPGGPEGVLMLQHDLLGRPFLALPLVVAATAGVVIAALWRLRGIRWDDWWLAAGLTAGLAFLACVAGGGLADGEYGAVLGAWWASLSGHTVFVFLLTALVWSRVVHRPPATQRDALAESPAPSR
ncbi:hypothetical protein [Streptomyces spiramenti]|uniref:Transmembrane protein n=1 Tax=Streptomyces spiramenti TaxID=2720606 RepID=A0ABX1AMU0_9ACTN|nr:hypothetical protein [Streptomyces spiramenti]NJP67585.1 hypothetical protein [Streptomyces spiramenti]